jgi:murein L,D-transpeptidase YcbB/YkuD
MRKRFDRLLAGIALALIGVASSFAVARPRVESVGPPPPSLNGHRSLPRREAPPAPPASERIVPSEPTAAPLPTPAPAVAQQPAATAPREAQHGFDIKGTLDRLFAASDTQIADKLRAIVVAKQFDKQVERMPDRKAIEAFYGARNYATLWIHDGRLTARAQAVIARLKDAASEGLDASDYPVPEFGTLTSATALAEGDIALTNSVLTFARHLQTGRISPRRVFAQVLYPDHTPEPADILKKVAGAGDVNATLDSFDPPHQGFRALKRKLAELRANGNVDTPEAQARIPDGRPIRPGARDDRVPMLRERLHVRGNPANTTYDRALYEAIRSLQYRNKMRPTGIIDAKTIALINGPKPLTTSQVIDRVQANMERWRWLPRDLGDTYVMVNIPDFSLKVVHDHRVVWHTKIVVGKPQTPTPLTTAVMDSVIINPSWYVPQSIIQNELLPAYQTDPNIFDRLGLEVKRGPDGNINVVQPPGAANALGRIKFNFPNRFQVYLHDTPEKNLFNYDRRAFSHGCMRVQDPTKFGEIILGLAMNGATLNSRQIYSLFGHEEHDFKLEKRPMVHLTYQTAFVDESGKLQLRDDLYGFDARIHAIMHSNERRIADIPPPPDPKRDLATIKSNQEILRRVERREALNPLHFFERLFR